MTAEQAPNFSGEYVLNRQASTLSPQASAISTAVLRFDHEEPSLRCEATFAPAEGEPIHFQFEQLSDGREVTTEHEGNTIMSSLRWDGRTLVSQINIEGRDFQMAMYWCYDLLDGERGLRAVEQIRGAGRDQDNVWIFDRASAGER